MVRVGAPAPDFTLEDERGQPVSLASFRGERWVVLVFYPKDFTPICTDELCGFRDRHAVLTRSGAVILGISADEGASHVKFKKQHELPFPLLSDPGRVVAKSYGATTAFGLVGGRKTVIVDPSGNVAHVISAMFNAHVHIRETEKFVIDAARTAHP